MATRAGVSTVRKRLKAPVRAALRGLRPVCSRSLIAPDTAMKPTAAETEKGMPLSNKASAPPARAKVVGPRRCSARLRLSNWPPQVREDPAGICTWCWTFPCASPTKPPRSRPRTWAWTTMRRLPLLRLIWFRPSATWMRATDDKGAVTPVAVACRLGVEGFEVDVDVGPVMEDGGDLAEADACQGLGILQPRNPGHGRWQRIGELAFHLLGRKRQPLRDRERKFAADRTECPPPDWLPTALWETVREQERSLSACSQNTGAAQSKPQWADLSRFSGWPSAP